MATYTHRFTPATGNDPDISLFHVVERPLYGSSRLGVDAQEVDLATATPTAPTTAHPSQWRYELTDHLGLACPERSRRVQAVVTEELLGLDGNNDQSVDQWAPVLLSAQDYEPFGALLPGRNYSSDSYRFGFNGKENDNEWHGATGTLQDYGMRAYDTRVARFFAVDPIASQYPWYTPYQFAGNTPIVAIDVDGLEPGVVLGNSTQVHAINQFFNTSEINSPNYAAFELKSYFNAELNLENHVRAGNRIKVLYIQVHGTSGSVYLNPGADGAFHTDPVPRGGGLPMRIDDSGISSPDIDWYLGLTKGKSPGEMNELVRENASNPIFAAIYRFQRMAQNVDEDGVIIMGACNAGANPEGIPLGDNLAKSMSALTGRKVLLSKDFVTQGTANGGYVLDRGLTGEHLEEGWSVGSNQGVQSMGAGRDLRLNSSGPLYEFTEKP